jgi:N-acetyltransferase 10
MPMCPARAKPQTPSPSYAPGDPVESWLHSLLCLDASTHLPRPPPKLPHPSECDLFYVERDTLFSFHK